MSRTFDQLDVKIFADGADLDRMAELARHDHIRGFTTNPTLMRQSGVADYEGFAREVLDAVGGKPVSFEVFSDDLDEMEKQARTISGWGPNVYVKVPVTTTAGVRSDGLIRRLAGDGVQQNVTAVMTAAQVEWIAAALSGGPRSIISVFAGRIADAGVDPVPIMLDSVATISGKPEIELLWASPREVFNIVQASDVGCDIITMTGDLIQKLPSLGKDLEQFSLETVQMFRRDAEQAGFTL